MSQLVELRALRPVPWFPMFTEVRHSQKGTDDCFPQSAMFSLETSRMLYLPKVIKVLDSWWMARCLSRWLSRNSPLKDGSVLDAHFGFPEGVACFRAAKKFGLPYFVTLRGIEQYWFQFRNIRQQMVQALNSATGVIAVSHSLKRAALECGVFENQIEVIPNGCDKQVFRAVDNRASRLELGLPCDGKVLVTTANIKSVKGHDTLFRALAQVHPAVDWRLYCIGAEDEKNFAQSIRSLAADLGISKRISFVGSLPPERIALYLNASDAFVLASRREGCCNALIEALACKKQCIVSDVGDNRVYASYFSNIQLFESGNVSALTSAIEGRLQQPCSSNDGHGLNRIPSWDEVGRQCIDYMAQRLSANQIERGTDHEV